MTRDAQAGFSLVEILVVLAILAVMSGVTLISLGAINRGAQPETEAKLFANRLSLAADEALVTGEELSLALDPTGYSVDVPASGSDGWSPHPSGLFGARHELSGRIRMEIDAGVDRIALRPDATGEAFSVVFSNADGGWRVSYDGFSASVAPSGR